MTAQQDREQLFLELLNRARMDPAMEGTRYGITDLSAGTGTTITTAAKQVLAPNSLLYNSATVHNQYMVANNLFSHTGSGGSAPADRMVTAGYGVKYPNGYYSFYGGENIAWTGTTGTLDATAQIYAQHANLFISPGHRDNILYTYFEEVGVSSITAYGYQGYNAQVSAQNFGSAITPGIHITGVSYNDTDGDNFYSVGESAAGRTVQLYNGASVLATTATAAAGGYSLYTTSTGTLRVEFSGGDLPSARSLSLVRTSTDTQNIKVDLTDGNTFETNSTATLGQNAANLTLLSFTNINGTGNELANVIIGNRGTNVLDGGAGNDYLNGHTGDDTLIGGTGDDILNGHTGTDRAVYAQNMAAYAFSYNAATGHYTVYNPDGSADTLIDVEQVQFADGVRTVSQLPLSSGAPARVASLSVTEAAIAEGNSGTKTLSFTVTLNAGSATSQSVSYSVAGSGSQAANATDFSGALTGLVTFLAGETSKTFTVQVQGDTVFEANETFTVTLHSPTAGLSLGTAAVVATITNDDAQGPNPVTGTAGADVLVGTVDVDHVQGLGGNDTVRNLGQNARIDNVDGGAGSDSVDLSTLATYAWVDLAYTGATGVEAWTVNGSTWMALANLSSVENVMGSVLSDKIWGDAVANTVNAGAGHDQLTGRAGNDILNGDAGNDIFFFSGTAASVGTDQIDGGADIDTADFAGLSVMAWVDLAYTGATGIEAWTLNGSTWTALANLTRVENVTGSAFADKLWGDATANVLSAGAGDDQLTGRGGNDILTGAAGDDTFFFSGDSLALGLDQVNGGSEIDTADFTGLSTYAWLDLAYTGASGIEAWTVVGTTWTALANLTAVENVTGTAHADKLWGDAMANVLKGAAGNDQLSGRAGSDVLNGGTGNDTLTGGSEADTFHFADLAFGTDTITDWQDGVDKISVALNLESGFGGLTFANNGTSSVTVSGFNTAGSIVVNAASAFSLDASDFIFV